MSSSRSSRREVQNVVVQVQPPANVSTNSTIYPAITVRASTRWSSSVAYLSAMATLYNSNGDVEYALQGNLNQSPLEIQENAGSGSSSRGIAAYFSFDDLSVSTPGTFYIHISVMGWSQDQSSCEVIGQVTTNYFGVY
ncbi:hypothetical protein QBC38DRAFT_487252 [Podospora fimiseda]|uniref:Velvet domain-containing protein n=1 Tax=Podospora fimiseda TaxID=252190 RepID=A0AAN7BI23_9PEZI|nr:hypothetical protein QBC38DRAFT_487252 [Podospora fimiseda]